MTSRSASYPGAWSSVNLRSNRKTVAIDTVVMSSPARYERTAVVLHRIVALLIIALIAAGWYMVGIPKNTPERAFFFNLHRSLGIVTAIFIVMLIVWRIRHVAPLLLFAMPKREGMAGNLNHHPFYVLMVLVTLTGYLTSSFSGYGLKLFGIALPHWGWEDAALRDDFTAVQRITALIFAVLIAIHISAALKHLLFDKDGVFQRVLPP
jgi:cytochrome b561